MLMERGLALLLCNYCMSVASIDLLKYHIGDLISEATEYFEYVDNTRSLLDTAELCPLPSEADFSWLPVSDLLTHCLPVLGTASHCLSSCLSVHVARKAAVSEVANLH